MTQCLLDVRGHWTSWLRRSLIVLSVSDVLSTAYVLGVHYVRQRGFPLTLKNLALGGQ